MDKCAPFISGTARNMAAFRALESAKSARERLFYDPYARRFLSASQRLLAACSGVTVLRWLVELYADSRAPGARISGIARTRLIDDWLCEEAIEACGWPLPVQAIWIGELTASIKTEMLPETFSTD